MYNKDTLKNSHLKKRQMAHHRLSPVTHNMYEVFMETDFTHGAQETEIRGTSSRKEEVPLETIEEHFYHDGNSELGSCFHTCRSFFHFIFLISMKKFDVPRD